VRRVDVNVRNNPVVLLAIHANPIGCQVTVTIKATTIWTWVWTDAVTRECQRNDQLKAQCSYLLVSQLQKDPAAVLLPTVIL
jgi:hypothetical protein